MHQGMTRRGFLKSAGSAAMVAPLLKKHGTSDTGPPGEGVYSRTIRLNVNGSENLVEVETRHTLAEALRNTLGLTGTKIVCDHASCGACTVILDDRIVFSCHILAIQADGKSIQTIEGIADGPTLHPLQQAFVDQDATQCGYCTPGMILALKNGLDRKAIHTADEVRTCISGNLCRCGAYHHIVAAAQQVINSMKDE